MVAGRELDAHVETRVFGRQVEWGKNFTPHDWATSDYATEMMGPGVRNWTLDNRPTHTAFHPPLETVPGYSTSIEAAWEVVEYMRAKDEWAFTLGTDTSGDWDATFWEGDTFHNATADTAPAAICKCALAAVGALPPTPGDE